MLVLLLVYAGHVLAKDQHPSVKTYLTSIFCFFQQGNQPKRTQVTSLFNSVMLVFRTANRNCISHSYKHMFLLTINAMALLGPNMYNIDEIINQSSVIGSGTPTRYLLKLRADYPDEYRKLTFGERNKDKPHKTFVMVGETGTGKTTLINTMVNYILGVQREDKIWFEITDDQSDLTQAHSQTSCITLYGFYLQESPVDLTIIDTPGFGDTRSIAMDQEIAMSLCSLIKSEEVGHEIDAVCLVVKATQNRLSDRQIYIFNAVQSLFGKDVAENIVLLFTHSTGAQPKDALTAVKEAKIKCAVKEKNQPVFFLFDNCQVQTSEEGYPEEHEQALEQSWNRSYRGMEIFFKFMETVKSKSLNMTGNVLQKQKMWKTNICNLKFRVDMIDKKQKELKQTQEVLEQNMDFIKNNETLKYEIEVPYKEKVDIDPSVAKTAMCCTVCQENCHYPGCWWVRNLSWCSVMKNGYCTVCSNKCHYSKHVKEAKIYQTKTRIEKRTYEELKKKYEDIIRAGMSLVKKMEEELQELEKEKIKLVMEAFHCVETLQIIALNADSLSTLKDIDFMIDKLKEIKEPEKARTLESIKNKEIKENEKARTLERISKKEIKEPEKARTLENISKEAEERKKQICVMPKRLGRGKTFALKNSEKTKKL
uniref:AIG1-type G domain-containing protein n=3 Tax=Cyprinus carpio TaxID=7962 RepID=A0A9J7ZGK9_CYPCA